MRRELNYHSISIEGFVVIKLDIFESHIRVSHRSYNITLRCPIKFILPYTLPFGSKLGIGLGGKFPHCDCYSCGGGEGASVSMVNWLEVSRRGVKRPSFPKHAWIERLNFAEIRHFWNNRRCLQLSIKKVFHILDPIHRSTNRCLMLKWIIKNGVNRVDNVL